MMNYQPKPFPNGRVAEHYMLFLIKRAYVCLTFQTKGGYKVSRTESYQLHFQASKKNNCFILFSTSISKVAHPLYSPTVFMSPLSATSRNLLNLFLVYLCSHPLTSLIPLSLGMEAFHSQGLAPHK